MIPARLGFQSRLADTRCMGRRGILRPRPVFCGSGCETVSCGVMRRSLRQETARDQMVFRETRLFLWSSDSEKRVPYTLKRQLLLFMAAVGSMALAMGIHESIFNNFLSDTFAMSADERGWLELPRELPGFLVVCMAGLLCAVPVTRMGLVGAVVFAGGMTGLAFLGASYRMMVLMMVTGSVGMHLLQPVGASIVLALADKTNKGKRMGQVGAVGTAGTVLGTGVIWLFLDRTNPPYLLGFLGVAFF